MTEESQQRITGEMRTEIVDPLTLQMAILSEGRLGAIQSYRCQPKPSIGGWETRPQKDKWEHDFFAVLNAPKGELITLSDGKTKMKGLGKGDKKALIFSHEEGKLAKRAAIKQVLEGKLRAPKNWDRVFAEEAGQTMDDLKSVYPELYEARTRTPIAPEETEEVEALGFFEESQITIPEEAEEEEEQEYETEPEPERARTYSVSATEEPETIEEDETDEYDIVLTVRPIATATIYRACDCFKMDVSDTDVPDWECYYRVKHPDTGKSIFIKEGENEDYSNLYLTIQD